MPLEIKEVQNPGLRFIWRDEARRRRQLNEPLCDLLAALHPVGTYAVLRILRTLLFADCFV